MIVRWCTTHLSKVVVPLDDPYDYWCCEASNRTADMTPCQIVEAEVTWH